jgi:hypothetical protein
MLDMFVCYANSAAWMCWLFSLAGNPDSLCLLCWLAGCLILQIIWYLGYDGYAGWLCWNRGRQDILDGWLFSIFWIISVYE